MSGGRAPSQIRDRIVGLRRVRADRLLPNPKNWRRHPKAQGEALKGLLQEIGYADALLARETPDGLMLIDGHLRAETTPKTEVPVLVLDLDEAEADKLLLTLDPLAAMAEMDGAATQALLEGVQTESEGVRAMLAGLQDEAQRLLEPEEGLTDPDTVPEDVEPVAKRGDVWACGDHRVMCGDSTDEADVKRLMAGEKAAMLWTDPPYGVAYVGKTEHELTITNDDGAGLYELLIAALTQAEAALEPGSPFYVARPAGALSVTFGRAILDGGWRFHQELQWVKDSMVLGHSDYHVQHETVIYGWTPGPGRSGRGRHKGSRWFGSHSETTVFEIPRPKASREHPTAKPVELIDVHLRNSSMAGGAILDSFLGSGTTMIAAERLGRRCFGMELDPRYVDVAVRRWEDYTGREAVLEADRVGVK
jgi:DNA modification methylase